MEIKKGDMYYIPANHLDIPASSKNQLFKVLIHMEDPADAFKVVVIVKHFKTKECNKVTLRVSKSVIESYGIKYGD